MPAGSENAKERTWLDSSRWGKQKYGYSACSWSAVDPGSFSTSTSEAVVRPHIAIRRGYRASRSQAVSWIWSALRADDSEGRVTRCR